MSISPCTCNHNSWRHNEQTTMRRLELAPLVCWTLARWSLRTALPGKSFLDNSVLGEHVLIMPESQRLCSASERISTSDKIYNKVKVTRTGQSSFPGKRYSCHVWLESSPGRSGFQQLARFSVVRLAWKRRLTLTLCDVNYGPACWNWRFKWMCSTWCRAGCWSIFDAFFHHGNMQKVFFPLDKVAGSLGGLWLVLAFQAYETKPKDPIWKQIPAMWAP